jgi:hypothetical protein
METTADPLPLKAGFAKSASSIYYDPYAGGQAQLEDCSQTEYFYDNHL